MKKVERNHRPGLSIPVLVVGAAGCLIGAWAVPVMQGTVLFTLPMQYRLLDVLHKLADDGDYLVACILLLFALVVPLCKLAIMLVYWAWLQVGLRLPVAALKPLDMIGRWAMLDIFIAAIVVSAMKLERIPGRATTGTAVTLLVATFLLSMAASWLLKRACRRRGADNARVMLG